MVRRTRSVAGFVTGGEYVSGTSVRPQARADSLLKMASWKGGPVGSSETIEWTRSLRTSVISQGINPPWECDSRMTGFPIVSRSWAPAAWTVDCCPVAELMNCTVEE